MKYLVILSFLILGACAEDGRDGINGTNGIDGAQGPVGLPGANGTNATMQSYSLGTLNACVNIDPGVYAKRTDTTEVKLFTASGCASANQIDTGGSLCPGENEVFVLSSTSLIIVNGSGSSLVVKKLVYQ